MTITGALFGKPRGKRSFGDVVSDFGLDDARLANCAKIKSWWKNEMYYLPFKGQKHYVKKWKTAAEGWCASWSLLVDPNKEAPVGRRKKESNSCALMVLATRQGDDI